MEEVKFEKIGTDGRALADTIDRVIHELAKITDDDAFIFMTIPNEGESRFIGSASGQMMLEFLELLSVAAMKLLEHTGDDKETVQ